MKVPMEAFQIETGRKTTMVFLTPAGAQETGLPSWIVGRGKSLPGAIADWVRRIEFERCGETKVEVICSPND